MRGRSPSSTARRPVAAWLATAALALAACGGDGGSTAVESSPAPTTAPATTAAATTVAPTTTAPATTVPGAVDDRFDPVCVDRVGTAPVPADDPALATLQTLGAEPVVQLDLPKIVDGQDDFGWVRAGVFRIPGGMLVDMRPYDGRQDPYSALVAVNADGSIRWQRCLDPAADVVRVADTGDPDEFLLMWSTYTGVDQFTNRFETWSLATGQLSRTWDEVLADNGIAVPAAEYRSPLWVDDQSTFVLTPDDDSVVGPDEAILATDLSTMEMRVLPSPGSDGSFTGPVAIGTTDDHRLLAFDSAIANSAAPVLAIESGDGWSTDAEEIAAAVGPRAGYDYAGEQQALTGWNAQGEQVWQRDDVLAMRREGFTSAVEGDVVLASACSGWGDPTSEDWCPGPMLIAVDAATGDTRWQFDGFWGVSIVGDGRAMVIGPYPGDGSVPADPPAWKMIDLATGEQVGTTTWTDPWTFGIGCCDDPQSAAATGGVVFSWDENTVEMWYPEQASTPLREVTLD